MPGPALVHFETLGCRLNHDETEGAAQAFTARGIPCTMGGLSSATAQDPGMTLCVLNTCTVTGKAEQKARRVIRLMLDKFPQAHVLVTGCYAQVDAPAIKQLCPDRIAVLAGTQKHLLIPIAQAYSAQSIHTLADLEAFVARHSAQAKPTEQRQFDLHASTFLRHSRATLKVQDGCSCACSFCKIRLARGTPASLPVQEAVRRVQELEAAGIAEVVLTGVNLSQYHAQDTDGQAVRLPELLSALLGGTSGIRIRLSSLYPQSVDDRLCAVLGHERIQPSFHLSIQSGSSRILGLMRRPHSLEQVTRAVSQLRSIKRDPFISCDLIAGFPTESAEDFAQTQRLCEQGDFAWIHAFPFSPRPGTDAATMGGQVSERDKAERVAWLTQQAVRGKVSYIRRWCGQTVDAVAETRLANGHDRAVTDNFLHAECEPSPHAQPGKPVRVTVLAPEEDAIRAGKEADCTGHML